MHYFLSSTKVTMVMRIRMIVVKLIEHVLCARLCADCFLCMVSPHVPHVVQHMRGKEAWGQPMGMGVLVGLRRKRKFKRKDSEFGFG